MNAKAKGTRNEHRSIRLLEAAGYSCTRAAASLGAWDIIGIGSTDIVLVQTKTNRWPDAAEIETMNLETAVAQPAARTFSTQALDNEAHGQTSTPSEGSPRG